MYALQEKLFLSDVIFCIFGGFNAH